MQPTNSHLSFDQMPIRGQPIPQPHEFPQNEQVADVKIKQPISKRIHSKVWKIRKEAFQELFHLVEQNFAVYNDYESHTVSFITDSNLLCQQKVIKILSVYLERTSLITLEPKALIKALIEKCLVVEKNSISEMTGELLFRLLDRYPEIVLSQLNEQLSNKNPKICSYSIKFLQKLVNTYGMQNLNYLQKFKSTFSLYANLGRITFKSQWTSLFQQTYRWIGPSVLSFPLHKEILEDVQKWAKNYSGQKRVIKRNLNLVVAQNKKESIEMEDDSSTQPVDVLKPFDSKWVDKVLEISKWKEKKERLEEFIKKISVKSIVPRQNFHYITLIKRLLTDNNINILQCGFKIVKQLCKGLKKHFVQSSKAIKSLIFSKLKDTKSSINDEACSTLLYMMNTLTIEDFFEDIKQGLFDKAANMKIQILKFLKKVLQIYGKQSMGIFKKLICEIGEKVEDSSSEVRELALNILCKLKIMNGLHFFENKLKKLPSKKVFIIQNSKNLEETPISIMTDKNTFSLQKYHENSELLSQTNRENKSTNVPTIPDQKSNLHEQFKTLNENQRYKLYQELLKESSTVIHENLFKNENLKVKESSSKTLKIILNLVKKSVKVVEVEHVNYLLSHDWKKCTYLLTNFFKNQNIATDAQEIIKKFGMGNPILPKKETKNSKQKINCQNLVSIIVKLSSFQEDLRLKAIDEADDFVAKLQPYVKEYSCEEKDALCKFYNILKNRLKDSQIIQNKSVSIVTELLKKGYLTKSQGEGNQLISELIKRFNDKNSKELNEFFTEIMKNHPSLFWAYLVFQVCNIELCLPIVMTIEKQIQSFLQYADYKLYILPLLTCLSNGFCTEKITQILNQIVEIFGESFVQKIIKDSKLPNLQNLTKKWNTTASKNCPYELTGGQIFSFTKEERLDDQIEEEFTFSPKQIMKIIKTFYELGEPFSRFAKVEDLAPGDLKIVQSLTPNLLANYSDLLLKWVFWKISKNISQNSVYCLLSLVKNIFNSCSLHELELILTIRILLTCVSSFKRGFFKQISEIFQIINMNPRQKGKSFKFLINYLFQDDSLIDEIVFFMLHHYSNIIEQEMVTLARIPKLTKNKEFSHYICSNFNQKMLEVYGFNFSSEKIKTKSENVEIEKLKENDELLIIKLFKFSFSNDLIEKLQIQTENQVEFQVSLNIRIMRTIIVPYLNHELSFINVYTYFRFFEEKIFSLKINSNQPNLPLILLYFRADLDQIKLENSSEMIKIINRLLETLLNKIQPKLMIEILLKLLRESMDHLECVKFNQYLIKTIGKIFKNEEAKKQYSLQMVFLQEINQLIGFFEFETESLILKSLKKLVKELIKGKQLLKQFLNEEESFKNLSIFFMEKQTEKKPMCEK